ncbi:2-methylcitrate dehydratase PrpD [Rhizodiscina lignyota]|uniref:2-methylcitrate dehydratase PrpD n=1 Tax=Rhizodiscina lignyota TaxID=1504668 RepID=A0A9P4IJP6_9PEZI|nr:2-methylcitrate dehydratase PrpD [Rhizodiscina lignyota]
MSQDLSVSSDRDRTLDLATYLSKLTYDDIPNDVVHIAKASILNSVGCGLSSAMLEPAKKLFAALDVTGKKPRPVTVLARPEHATVDDAALLNGLSMTARFFDDTHLGTVIHPSGPPLAAILAYAEAHHMSGKDVIVAFLVGVETLLAVGYALGLGPYRKGWHLTSITGTFGATAAIAKLMNLPPEKFAIAFGHASSMAAGSRGVFATDTLIMHAGRAAQNGLLAARIAREGFGSTTHALEKWVQLISVGDSNPSLVSAPADAKPNERKWEILENAFKPYPCGIVIHPIIDAGVEGHQYFFKSDDSPIKGKSPRDALDIFPEIEVLVTPLTLRLCSVKHPENFPQVMFSTYHGLAVGLVYGNGGIKEFSGEVANDPVIKALRDRTTLKTDDSLGDDQASVTFTYSSSTGRGEKKVFIEHATGSLLNPMTDKQLDTKFLDQAIAGNVDKGSASEALKELWDLEKVDDIGSVMKKLVSASVP